MTKKIRTFSTSEFLGEYFSPHPKLTQIIKKDYGKFFIVNIQDLIKFSKLPVPPTRAETHTIIFLTSGVATMNIGFQKTVITEKECLVVPAGQVFSYENYEVNEGFICVFGTDFLLGKVGNNDLIKEFEFLNVWGNPIIQINIKSAKYLKQTFQRIYDEYSENGLQNINLLQSYFIALLCELQHIYQPLSKSSNKAAVNLTNKFKDLLNQNIRFKYLVTDYASMLNVSPNHLNKCVKTITQKTVTKWIDEMLILEAKVLLFQTNNSINEIASELGVLDQSYFSRLFKKYEGVSPLEYRKKIEKS